MHTRPLEQSTTITGLASALELGCAEDTGTIVTIEVYLLIDWLLSDLTQGIESMQCMYWCTRCVQMDKGKYNSGLIMFIGVEAELKACREWSRWISWVLPHGTYASAWPLPVWILTKTGLYNISPTVLCLHEVSIVLIEYGCMVAWECLVPMISWQTKQTGPNCLL